ncbi:endonuclease, partial [Marinitenerispora sediminis]
GGQQPPRRTVRALVEVPGAQSSRYAAATFTARRPRLRIDAVLTAPELTVRRAGVPVDLLAAADVTAASDHRPVLVDLEL